MYYGDLTQTKCQHKSSRHSHTAHIQIHLTCTNTKSSSYFHHHEITRFQSQRDDKERAITTGDDDTVQKRIEQKATKVQTPGFYCRLYRKIVESSGFNYRYWVTKRSIDNKDKHEATVILRKCPLVDYGAKVNINYKHKAHRYNQKAHIQPDQKLQTTKLDSPFTSHDIARCKRRRVRHQRKSYLFQFGGSSVSFLQSNISNHKNWPRQNNPRKEGSRWIDHSLHKGSSEGFIKNNSVLQGTIGATILETVRSSVFKGVTKFNKAADSTYIGTPSRFLLVYFLTQQRK